ncbi:MAG TPA: hypothetical protein VHH32_08755 [Gemmatimonadales bacterium]|nr:hypothetical protein [Gemmatimonadales bacterium]
MRLTVAQTATSAAWLLLLWMLGGVTAAAQVGHPPESSPYRDIRKGHTVTPTAGYFSGDGGEFGIGPHSGPLFGARYDIRTAHALQIGLGIAHGSLERFIVNPFVRLANRRTGPVNQSVTFAEVDLQLNVTGGKTWNRIAPYIGAGAGIAFASGTPADTSQYEFGNKLYLVPHAGVRVFFSDRLHLRAEARATFWKLNYPTTFQQEPVEEPGTQENPNAVIPPGENLSEWTASSWLQAGVGYSFSP